MLLGALAISIWIFYFNNHISSFTRIIYGTTQPDEATLANWKNDCIKHNGQFNNCGSPCEGQSESCVIAVCAYTCEKITVK
jgi:hypothetical protein